MKTINNTAPMPITPQGCNGEWIWNGYEITSQGIDIDGEPFQRKGQWQWVASITSADNAWMANASAQEIASFYKPKSKREEEQISNIAACVIFVIVAIAAFLIL